MKDHNKSLSRILIALSMLVFASLGAACGGDDKSLCEQNGEALCAEACACGGAAGCVVGDATATLTFDNEADCNAFLVGFGCQGDDGSMDAMFQACLDVLDTGMCVDTGDGTQAFTPPDACNSQN